MPDSTTITQSQEFLSPLQIANLMGLNVATIRRYINQGIIPAVKVGNGNYNTRMFIPKEWVSALMTEAQNNVK